MQYEQDNAMMDNKLSKSKLLITLYRLLIKLQSLYNLFLLNIIPNCYQIVLLIILLKYYF